MKCTQVIRRLSAYLDREVSNEDKALISRHLDTCPGCRQELERLTRLSGYLALIEDVEVQPYFMTRLRQRIADREAKHAAPWWFSEWIRRAAIPVAAAAVLILTALTGSYFGKAVYHWKTGGESGAVMEVANHAGSVLFNESPKSSLGQFTNQLCEGGISE
jgi:anti-sigma factor RsiW